MIAPTSTNGKSGGKRPWITPSLVVALCKAVARRAAVLWFYLWARADKDTGETWPTTREIASDLRMQAGKVSHDIKELEGAGLLAVTREPGGRSTYRVLAPSKVYSKTDTLTQEGVGQNGHGVWPETDTQCGTKRTHRQHTTTKDSTNDSTKARRRAVDVVIPESLSSEKFQTSWSEWITYRTKRKLSKEPMTLSKQLTMLAGLGTDGAIEAIQTSIRNGWQGLFEPKGHSNGNGKSRTHLGPGNVLTPGAEQADPTVGTW